MTLRSMISCLIDSLVMERLKRPAWIIQARSELQYSDDYCFNMNVLNDPEDTISICR